MRGRHVVAPIILLSLASACAHQPVAAPNADAPVKATATATKPALAVTIPPGPDSTPWWTTSGRASRGITSTVVPADLLLDVGSAELSPQADQVLGGLLVAALVQSTVTIGVDGYTDSDGSDAYNQQLSENRADAVGTWFIAGGVNQARITTRGWGKSHPIAPNTDPVGKARNRRVEITMRTVTNSGGRA